MKPRLISQTLFTFAAFGLCSVVEADWFMEPFARASLLLDDNVRFSSSGEKSSTGVVTDIGVVFKNKTEAIRTLVTPRISYRGYAEDSDLNSFDQYLDFSTTSFGERSDLGLKLGFANDSTLTSEEEDSGITFLGKRRRYISMEPSWRYFLSPLTSVQLSYRFDGSQYEDSGEFGLNDFDFQVARADLERRLAEDRDFVVRAFYQRYKVIELTNKANSVGLELGYKQRFSPRMEGSFFVGGVNTNSTVAGKDDTVSGVSASAHLAYKAETVRYEVTYGAGVAPSSTGEVYVQNRLDLFVSGRASAEFSWGLRGVVQDRSTINENSTQTDRLYYRVSPEVSWRINRDWSMKGSYTFSAEDRDSDSAERNQLYVGVEFRKPNIRVY